MGLVSADALSRVAATRSRRSASSNRRKTAYGGGRSLSRSYPSGDRRSAPALPRCRQSGAARRENDGTAAGLDRPARRIGSDIALASPPPQAALERTPSF